MLKQTAAVYRPPGEEALAGLWAVPLPAGRHRRHVPPHHGLGHAGQGLQLDQHGPGGGRPGGQRQGGGCCDLVTRVQSFR